MFLGAIFHAGDEEYMNAFKKAVIETKSEHIAPSFKVETSIKQVEVNTDSFKTAAAGSYEYVYIFCTQILKLTHYIDIFFIIVDFFYICA